MIRPYDMNIYWDAPPKPGVFSDYPEFNISTELDLVKFDAWVCDPLVKRNHAELIPGLKYLVTPSTGTNHIDLDACKEAGIKVLNLLDDKTALKQIKASSEFTFWHILTALRNGGFRQWQTYNRDDDMMRGHELAGKYVGIIGFGRIGKNIGKWLTAFDADWDYYDPLYRSKNIMPRLFKNCDIIVISCTLDETTRNMIGADLLNSMKPGAILVNTARAEIINEKDLVNWTKKGRYYSADVLHSEVNREHINSELLGMSNCFITPHLAGCSVESEEKAARIALNLLRKELK